MPSAWAAMISTTATGSKVEVHQNEALGGWSIAGRFVIGYSSSDQSSPHPSSSFDPGAAPMNRILRSMAFVSPVGIALLLSVAPLSNCFADEKELAADFVQAQFAANDPQVGDELGADRNIERPVRF